MFPNKVSIPICLFRKETAMKIIVSELCSNRSHRIGEQKMTQHNKLLDLWWWTTSVPSVKLLLFLRLYHLLNVFYFSAIPKNRPSVLYHQTNFSEKCPKKQLLVLALKYTKIRYESWFLEKQAQIKRTFTRCETIF